MDAQERSDRLSAALKYYKEHQEDFVLKYRGQFVLISDGEVLGAFDTSIEALTEVKAKYAERAVLIQEVAEGEESYSQTFHSRVSFDQSRRASA